MTGRVRIMRSRRLAPSVARCLEPSLEWLERHAHTLPVQGTVLVGPPDPAWWATVRGGTDPLVVIGAVGPLPPSPVMADVVRRADVVVALSGDEAARLAVLAPVRRVVIARLSAPAPDGTVAGVAWDERSPAACRVHAVWLRLHGDTPPRDGAGVRWVSGVGSSPVADTLCAAADGAVAIAAPGCDALAEIRACGGLVGRSPLDAIEATLLVRGAPALHDALVQRGRRPDAGGPLPGTAAAVLEALTAAGDPGTDW